MGESSLIQDDDVLSKWARIHEDVLRRVSCPRLPQKLGSTSKRYFVYRKPTWKNFDNLDIIHRDVFLTVRSHAPRHYARTQLVASTRITSIASLVL